MASTLRLFPLPLPLFLLILLGSSESGQGLLLVKVEGEEVLLYYKETSTAVLNLTCPTMNCTEQVYLLTARAGHPDIAEITTDNNTMKMATELVGDTQVGSVAVPLRGAFLGHTTLHMNASFSSFSSPSILNDIPVRVIRRERIVDVIFDVVVRIMMILITIGFGAALNLDDIKGHFQRPYGIITGFLCQFGIMPPLAIGLAKATGMPNNFAYGLFCLACSPGGGPSNIWTLLLGGDLNLSIAMTLVSTIAALGMTPLWLYITNGLFIEGDVIIPYTDVVIALISLVLPCILGILVKRFFPRIAAALVKGLKIIMLVVLIVAAASGVMVNAYVPELLMRVTWRTIIPCIATPWSAYLISGGIAFIFRRPWIQVKTIAIETSIQNVTVALVILSTSFGQPDEDIARFSVLFTSSVTTIPLLIIALPIIFRNIKQKVQNCKAKRSKGDNDEDVDQEVQKEKEIDNKKLEKNESLDIDDATIDKEEKQLQNSCTGPQEIGVTITEGGNQYTRL